MLNSLSHKFKVHLTMAAAVGSSLEARLSALEGQLGVSSSSEESTQNGMSSRLDALQSMIEMQTTSQFRETWQ
jgi:hypothetical protein